MSAYSVGDAPSVSPASKQSNPNLALEIDRYSTSAGFGLGFVTRCRGSVKVYILQARSDF